MSLESLVPVADEAISSMVLHPNQALGKNIEIHSQQNGLFFGTEMEIDNDQLSIITDIDEATCHANAFVGTETINLPPFVKR